MVHEKERRKIIDDQHAQMSAKNLGRSLLNAKKSIKDAAEYNLHLNQDRKEERSSYFDMQTQVKTFDTFCAYIHTLFFT